MRTTLSLDDDVAALLARIRRSRQVRLKELVNEALRAGLRHVSTPPRRRKPYRTRTVSLGRCLVGNLDDVTEALAVAEGESFK
ncbi:MAG: DUF2191 domain-containing protein [Acidobacteria bacterium]|nr:DUF2191 domain-containing protein [Acidobacteriota bacterium]